MARQEPVESIRRTSDSGSRDSEGPEFIRYVDSRETQINEVWDFGYDGVTHEVQPTAQVYFRDGVVGEFSSDYMTESGRRIPLHGRITINGSFEHLGVPGDENLLDPGPSWGDGGTTTIQNWGIQPG